MAARHITGEQHSRANKRDSQLERAVRRPDNNVRFINGRDQGLEGKTKARPVAWNIPAPLVPADKR